MSAPNLEDIVEAGVYAGLENIHVSGVAIVISYDKATHTISAQPINQQYHVNDDGDLEKTTPTVIPHIPVWTYGSGNNRITLPVQKGSLVFLVHTSHSNDAWHHSAGVGIVDPQDRRRNDFTDAIALPGLLTIGVAKQGGSAKVVDNAMVLHVDEKLLLGGDTDTHPVARDIDVIEGVKGVLTDGTVISSFAAYQAALAALAAAIVSGIGIPAATIAVAEAKDDLEDAIDTYFDAHEIGSDIVEAK